MPDRHDATPEGSDPSRARRAPRDDDRHQPARRLAAGDVVGYVNDGYLLYCFVARDTQKYANILRDPRISIAIGSDAPDPADIKGLSLAGRAVEVTDRVEFDDVAKLRLKKYPEYAAATVPLNADGAGRVAPLPPAHIALLRIAPDIISVLDYAQGFGHSEVVTFSDRDLDVHLESGRHGWNGSAAAG